MISAGHPNRQTPQHESSPLYLSHTFQSIACHCTASLEPPLLHFLSGDSSATPLTKRKKKVHREICRITPAFKDSSYARILIYNIDKLLSVAMLRTLHKHMFASLKHQVSTTRSYHSNQEKLKKINSLNEDKGLRRKKPVMLMSCFTPFRESEETHKKEMDLNISHAALITCYILQRVEAFLRHCCMISLAL